MGSKVYGSLVVGVLITETDYLVTTGSAHTCSRGHIRHNPTAKFCEQDGSRFRQETTEDFTPQFTAWAKSLGVPPDRLLTDLFAAEDPDPERIGIFFVDAVSSNESQESFALGFLVSGTDDANEGPDTEVLGISLGCISDRAKAAEELAHNLGIKRKAQVFLNLFISEHSRASENNPFSENSDPFSGDSDDI